MDKISNSASGRIKRSLADSLKKLMLQKPLDKITIQELTDSCGIRRQSFYYHFEDIYDLLRWMYEEEAVPLLHQHEGAMLWQEGLLQLFQYLQENRQICIATLNSMGRDHLLRFFEADIYAIIQNTIEQIAASIGDMSAQSGSAGIDIEMLTHFYVVALTGLLKSWLLGEINNTPEEVISFIDTILQDHIRGASARINHSCTAARPNDPASE